MLHLSRTILLLICLTVLFASFVGAQEKLLSDLFVVMVNGKVGFIDRTGKVKIKPQFNSANDFQKDWLRSELLEEVKQVTSIKRANF